MVWLWQHCADLCLQEQEARTELLRDRTRKRQHNEIEASSSTEVIESASQPANKLVKSTSDISLIQRGHINFFKDIEQGVRALENLKSAM